MIYYIADTHFKDQTIFDKCKRPFQSVQEFEDMVVSNWNKKITDNDTVYILGDIGSDDKSSIDIFRRLKGHKHLIVGNHDLEILEYIKTSLIFESIKFIDLIEDSGYKVCVCHYPLMDWMEFTRNGYFVYGHVHNKTPLNGIAYKQIKDYYKDKPAFNCGVDVTGYTPVTLKEMIKLKETNKDEPYIN